MKKTKENKFKKRQSAKKWVRGFTLIELLIASAIFAAATVLVVGSFGISTRNQRQVRVNRDISQNIRYVAQEIAQQVEFSLNEPLNIWKPGGGKGLPVTQDSNQVYNFAVLTSTTKSDVTDNSTGNILLVRSADNRCRYYRTVVDTSVPEKPKRVAVFIDKNEGCDNPHFEGPYYLTDGKADVSLEFNGVMNQKAKTTQAYVWVSINSADPAGSEFTLPMNTSTMATIRNYNGEN